MATSGDYSFTQTKEELIYDAFQLAGIYGLDRPVSARDLAFASNLLNKLIKAWSAKGLHLWCKEEATLFVTQYTARYTLSNNTLAGANWANVDNTAIYQLSSRALASSTQIDLNSVDGLSVGYNIGVVLDDGSTHWTTVQAINSLLVTLNAALPSEASSYNQVYAYSTRAYKPSRIYSCRRVSGIDLGVTTTISEVWLKAMAYQDYMNLAAKTVNGVPSAYMYNPDDTFGYLYLWERPISSDMRIDFTYERLIQDLDTVNDNFDLPSEWLEPLTYQLAWRLCTPYGKDERARDLLAVGSQMLENLLDWDAEIVSLKIKPQIGWPDNGNY